MWTPPHVFEAAKTSLDALLGRMGYAVLPVALAPEAFGSAHAEYRSSNRAVRLVWDGKESALWAEVDQDGHWLDVEALVSGGSLALCKEQGPERAAALVESVRALLAAE